MWSEREEVGYELRPEGRREAQHAHARHEHRKGAARGRWVGIFLKLEDISLLIYSKLPSDSAFFIRNIVGSSFLWEAHFLEI